MKLIVELDEKNGKIRVSSNDDIMDVGAANFLLDLAKLELMAEWSSQMENSILAIEGEDDGDTDS